MAQAIAVDREQLWLLVWTGSRMNEADGSTLQWGRVLDLARNELWPEAYIHTLLRVGDWQALRVPVPTQALLAQARVRALR